MRQSNNISPLKKYIEYGDGIPSVNLRNIGGRVITMKTDTQLNLPHDWFTVTLTYDDVKNYCRSTIVCLEQIPSGVPVSVIIPDELIDMNDEHWYSLLSELKSREQDNGLVIIQVLVATKNRRCADALINNVPTLLSREKNVIQIVKDVRHTTRQTQYRRRKNIVLNF